MRPVCLIALAIILTCNKTCCQATSKELSVPLYFEIDDIYHKSVFQQTTLTVKSPHDNLIFDSKNFKGYKIFQEKPVATITDTGTYVIDLAFYKDSASPISIIKEHFTINGNENKVELKVNLAGFKTYENDIFINKYFGNKYNVLLKRLWNPQALFKSKKQIFPVYEWTNTSDSVIYGIEHFEPTYSAITWEATRKIAFIQLQAVYKNVWYSFDWNTPWLQAALQKGQTGKTISTVGLENGRKIFTKKFTYRILIEYCVNDVQTRPGKITGTGDDYFYHERNIYQLTDEFTL